MENEESIVTDAVRGEVEDVKGEDPVPQADLPSTREDQDTGETEDAPTDTVAAVEEEDTSMEATDAPEEAPAPDADAEAAGDQTEAAAKAQTGAQAQVEAEPEAESEAAAAAEELKAKAKAQQEEEKAQRVEEEARLEKHQQHQEQEQLQKQQQQQQQQKQQQQQQQSSGWGWGGWLSSVVDKSAKLVSDLALTVEEEHRPSPSAGGGLGLKLYRTDEELAEEQKRKEELEKLREEQAKDTVLEERLITGTVQAFSGASEYLGGVLTDLKETAAKVAAEIDVATISDQASSMAAHTIDALENVSSKTMTMLQAGEGSAAGAQQLGEIALNTQTGKEVADAACNRSEKAPSAPSGPPTFQKLFDQELGNVYLQALELLSTECTMKVQEAQRKCGKGQMQLLVAHLQLVRDRFEDEDEPDPSEPLPEMAISSKATSVLDKLEELRTQAEANAKELSATAEEAIRAAANADSANGEADAEVPSKGERVAAAAEAQLLAVHQSALKMLAKVSSVSVELVNRVGESWLVNGKEAPADNVEEGQGLPQPSLSIQQAAYVQLLSAKLADDMSNSAFFFVCAVRKISAVCTELLKGDEAAGAEDIVATCNDKINNIYLDTGDAISNVHDGKDFLIPLVQWVYLLAEAGITA